MGEREFLELIEGDMKKLGAKVKTAPLEIYRLVLGDVQFMALANGDKTTIIVNGEGVAKGTLFQIIEIDTLDSNKSTGKSVLVKVTHSDQWDDTPCRYIRKGCSALSVVVLERYQS